MNTRSAITGDHAHASRTPAASPTAVGIDFNTPHAYVDIGHSRLAYWGVGQGPDLVLVHGWPLHSATYRRIVPELSDHFRCHLFDLPGAGQTQTSAKAPFGIQAHGESLLKAIRARGITQYSLLGHDSGAAIMQFTAALDSGNVVSLVMGDTETPGYHSRLLSLFLKVGQVPKGPNLVFKALGIKAYRQSLLGLGACFTDPNYMEGDFFHWFIEPLLRSAQTRAWQAKLLKHFNAEDIRSLIRIQENTRVPVQLLWGSDDPFFLLADARKMMQRFQGEVELEVIPGGKLFIHEDHAERFARQTIHFLKRQPPM